MDKAKILQAAKAELMPHTWERKMVKRLYLIGMVLLGSVVFASLAPRKNVTVSDIHGTELLRFCNIPNDTIELQFCKAFIVGVRDGAVLATELRGAKPIIETPSEAKEEQLKAIVVKYLNDHPEEHHKPAALLVIFALSQVFPPQDKAAK